MIGRHLRGGAALAVVVSGIPQLVCAQEPITAFTNVAVLPMDRARVLTGQTVLVQGAHIAALGASDRVTIPPGARLIDGAGKYLIPGLADMHVHLDAAVPDSALADVLFSHIANGVTTVRDMHGGRADTSRGDGPAKLALRARLAAGAIPGPRLYLAGDPDWSTAEAAARTTAGLRAAGYDFVKHYGFEGAVGDSVVAAARRTGLPVVGHMPPDLGFGRVLRDAWASLEHLGGYFEHLVGLTGSANALFMEPGFASRVSIDTVAWMKPGHRLDERKMAAVAAATARAAVWNCPTLSIHQGIVHWLREQADRQRPADDVSAEMTAGLLASARVLDRWNHANETIVKALADAGAGLLLGTDAQAGTAFGFAVHDELAALVRAGLTPYQALESGTRNAAAFLGALDSTGTIAVGKRADLVLLAGNPLDDIGYTAGPAGVMIAGQWFSRETIDGRLDAALSENVEVYREARRRTWKH